MTPLAIALSLTADESIKFLLENGTDDRKTSVDEKLLPITHGIFHDTQSLRCVEILLNHVEEKEVRKEMVGCINSNNNYEGITALHDACYSHSNDALKLFLESGADLNIRDKRGKEHYYLLPVMHLSNVCTLIKESFESNKQHCR